MIELTPRDEEVVTFLKKGFIADTLLLNDLFFHSIKPCNRRLLKLHQHSLVKRGRKHSQEPFIYYHHRMPEDIQHSLLKSKLFAQFKNSDLTILDYYSKYNLVCLSIDLLLIVKTQQHTLAVLAFIRTRGSFQSDRIERAYRNSTEARLMGEKLMQLASFDDLAIVSCSPKDCYTPFDHYHIRPTHLAEDSQRFIQELQQWKLNR